MQDLKEELVQKKVRFFGILPTFQYNTTNLNACTLRKASTAAQGLVINGVFLLLLPVALMVLNDNGVFKCSTNYSSNKIMVIFLSTPTYSQKTVKLYIDDTMYVQV